MRLLVRKMGEDDYESYLKLFDEAYNEYLGSLRLKNPQQYCKERQDKREVTRARFYFYLNTGSSFAAEIDGEVVGYVAAQTIPYMRERDRVLWIEYVVTNRKCRRRGIATALLKKLREYAKQGAIDTIYATISPDNIASIKLHQKLGFNVRDLKMASLQANQ